jgi:hypothetical protein
MMLSSDGAGTVLRLVSETALRGLQIHLSGMQSEPRVRGSSGAPIVSADLSRKPVKRSAPEESALIRRLTYSPASKEFRFLLADDASVLEPGDVLEISGLPAGFAPADIRYAVAIGSNGQRIDLAAANAVGTDGGGSIVPGPAVSLFPNPVRHGEPATLSVTGRGASGDALVRVDLVDLLGRRIRHATPAVFGTDTIRLDSSLLVPGLYFLRLRTAAWNRTVPVTVIR